MADTAPKRWWIEDVVDEVEKFRESLQFQLPGSDVNFHTMTDEELREQLARFGAYEGYIETQLSWLDATKVGMQRIYDNAVTRAMSLIENASEKKKLKDTLESDAVAAHPELKELRRQLVEFEAKLVAATHLRDALDIYWRTVSRLLSSRGIEVGKV
jgi:hydrogenase maturation factor